MTSIATRPSTQQDSLLLLKARLEAAEKSELFRTGRSGVYTKLGDVREHDGGWQVLAHKIHRKSDVNDPKIAARIEHQIEEQQLHRTVRSATAYKYRATTPPPQRTSAPPSVKKTVVCTTKRLELEPDVKDPLTILQSKLLRAEFSERLRTGRSAAPTKLAAIREHDGGRQELAHRLLKKSDITDVKVAARLENKIEEEQYKRTARSVAFNH